MKNFELSNETWDNRFRPGFRSLFRKCVQMSLYSVRWCLIWQSSFRKLMQTSIWFMCLYPKYMITGWTHLLKHNVSWCALFALTWDLSLRYRHNLLICIVTVCCSVLQRCQWSTTSTKMPSVEFHWQAQTLLVFIPLHILNDVIFMLFS